MLSLRRRRKANQLMAMLFLFIVTALLVNIKLQKRNFKSTKVHENRTALDSKLNIWLAGAGANIDPADTSNLRERIDQNIKIIKLKIHMLGRSFGNRIKLVKSLISDNKSDEASPLVVVSNIRQTFKKEVKFDEISAELLNLLMSDELEQWRLERSDRLSFAIREELRFLQNELPCTAETKFYCNINHNYTCDFGCQVHEMASCLHAASYLNRTLLLVSKNWNYESNRYEDYLEPLSETCVLKPDEQSKPINHSNVLVNTVRNGYKLPHEWRPRVPEQLKDRIGEFHGEPFAWYYSQMVGYLITYNKNFTLVMNQIRNTIYGFHSPIAGIHIQRRDDKGNKADYHSNEEYMRHVEEYFDVLDLRTGLNNTRTVYLVTDDHKAYNDLSKQYRSYTFISNQIGANLALYNISIPLVFQSSISDMQMLAQTDFLVCTLSTALCRVMVELLQLSFSDASWRFRSLDEQFYVYAGHRIQHVALYDHSNSVNPSSPTHNVLSAAVAMPNIVKKELELKRGDRVEFVHGRKSVRGFKMNGYVLAKNLRTGLTGHIPNYKVYNLILFENAQKNVGGMFGAANRILRRMYLELVDLTAFFTFQMEDIYLRKNQSMKTPFPEMLEKRMQFIDFHVKERIEALLSQAVDLDRKAKAVDLKMKAKSEE